MTVSQNEAAWADFWRSGGVGPESGCLPSRLRLIDAVQRRVWQQVARQLPRNARVLDLGTGDGAVLAKIRDVRTDLKLIGVDSSPVLRPAPKGVTLKSAVPMEALPFPPASFDLVTSQFGFEYAETEKVGPEVFRVLRRQRTFVFIIHHAEGRIVEHNAGRVEVLAWAVRESGLLEKAEALAKARTIANIATPRLFRDAPADARRRFADQPVGEEFVTAILQTLELGRRAPLAESIEVLSTLRARAENEIARIEALGRAARTPQQIGIIRRNLQAAGFEVEEPATLNEDGERRPFGWILRGNKRD